MHCIWLNKIYNDDYKFVADTHIILEEFAVDNKMVVKTYF